MQQYYPVKGTRDGVIRKYSNIRISWRHQHNNNIVTSASWRVGIVKLKLVLGGRFLDIFMCYAQNILRVALTLPGKYSQSNCNKDILVCLSKWVIEEELCSFVFCFKVWCKGVNMEMLLNYISYQFTSLR